ncbi:MAG: Hsp70 family protein, partial [Odoribacter sp.]|nr:Hsp70 family protein [Odoribacter sp.]
ATDGVMLGGDDLDDALAQEVLKTLRVPIRFRTKQRVKALCGKMRCAKEELQKEGVSQVQVDLPEFGDGACYTLDEETYKNCVYGVFGKTITMTENLIHTYLASYEEPKIVFVGGSSNCPYLKALIHSRLGMEEITCDMTPDYVVAMGVSLYAELVEKGVADQCVYDVTKRLCIEDSHGRTITVIDSDTSVPCKNTITVSNFETSAYLQLKLYQGDSIIAEQNDYIGRMDYHYGKVREAGDGIVEVTVNVSSDGIISLSAVDILQGEESVRKVQLTER